MLRLGFVLALAASHVAACAKHSPQPSRAASIVTIPAPAVIDASSPAPATRSSSPVTAGDPLSLEPRADVPDGSADCEATCRGSAGAALEHQLAARARKSRSCYDHALAVDPALPGGRLLVEMRIAKTGAVCGAKLLKDELLTSNVSTCVLNLLKSPAYAPPEGGSCVTVNVPLAFVRPPDAGTAP